VTAHLDRDFQVMTERALSEIVLRRISQRSTRTYQIPGADPLTFEVVESPLVRDGRVWAIAGVGRDITQEVTLERKLWDRAETRQSVVDFALRTSLGLVKGYVYTLGQNHAMDDVRRIRYVSIIEEEIERLAKIIEDLLDVRRMESGNFEVQSEVVDLAECVQFAVRHCTEEAERGEITLKVRLPETPSPVYAPREALARVVLNLLQNGVHYTLHGGEVSLEVEEHEAYVEIFVRDNGVGIPENELPYIFDKYYRGRNGGAASAQGTGLGLMIARTLVEAMGGQILVTSRVGVGSEFRVVLPRRPVSSGDAGEAEYWKLSSNGATAAAI
jgi:two-component system, OmpR family, sensor histidine kinase ResE